MGLYRVEVPVTRATGVQEYRVEAASPEEAKTMVEYGKSPVYDERLEVEEVSGDKDEWDVEDLNAGT